MMEKERGDVMDENSSSPSRGTTEKSGSWGGVTPREIQGLEQRNGSGRYLTKLFNTKEPSGEKRGGGGYLWGVGMCGKESLT